MGNGATGKTRDWVKILLVVSLALNLLVVGVAAGFALAVVAGLTLAACATRPAAVPTPGTSPATPVRGVTPCSDRNSLAISPRIAKLTFWGMSPVSLAVTMASSFETTTPTTCPSPLTTGPPELPGCTGAEICITRLSPPRPRCEVTEPRVTFSPLRMPASG